MFKSLNGSLIPNSLRGPLLIETTGLPRFWITVWAFYSMKDLADASKIKQLRYIEQFYTFSEQLKGSGKLDNAIKDVDLEILGEILEAYFLKLQNQPVLNRSTQIKWQAAFLFIQDTILRLTKSNFPSAKIHSIESHLNRLNLLYQQLRLGKMRNQEILRSLPSSVVEALYSTLDPTSPRNPFRNIKTRWRVFVIFIVLLHEGMRRGELLLLPTDAVRSGFDKTLNRDRLWLTIVESPYGGDSRYSKPSIKTVNSIRQIPVSELTSNIIQEYIDNYRGKPNHSYLINSQHNKPLSTESITLIFHKITSSLPKDILKDLENRTGKTSISPHDLRHTCAVVRLNQLLTQGDSMDEALQKMRTFFGWSRSSDMPRKYARAVFEDRLARVWNNIFDDRVAILRAIPEVLK